MKKWSYIKLLAVLTVIDIIVLLLRNKMSPAGSPDLNFLPYNLFLGLIPLLIAWVSYFFSGKVGAFVIIIFSFLWLVFYPNAPYMITDTIHINDTATIQVDTQYYQLMRPHIVTVPGGQEVHAGVTKISSHIAIFDSLVIFLYAMLSMFYGFFSLKIMSKLWTNFFGSKASYIMMVCSVILSGLGIYLGRMANLRLNTTDIFTRPLYVIHSIMECLVPISSNVPTYTIIFLFSLIQFSFLVMMRDMDETDTKAL